MWQEPEWAWVLKKIASRRSRVFSELAQARAKRFPRDHLPWAQASRRLGRAGRLSEPAQVQSDFVQPPWDPVLASERGSASESEWPLEQASVSESEWPSEQASVSESEWPSERASASGLEWPSEQALASELEWPSEQASVSKCLRQEPPQEWSEGGRLPGSLVQERNVSGKG